MKFSKFFGIAVIAALTTGEANAAFFSSDNFLAPVRGASRAASGWVINPSAVGTALGSNGAPVAAAAQSGEAARALKLGVGETISAGSSNRSGFFSDSYNLTLAEEAIVSIDLQDREYGVLFNTEKLSLSMVDADGNLVAQAGEGENFVTSMLAAGDYSVSVTGVSQAVRGSTYGLSMKADMPIPAAAWLFASALAVLVGARHRRKA